jgi:hypothetical protein
MARGTAVNKGFQGSASKMRSTRKYRGAGRAPAAQEFLSVILTPHLAPSEYAVSKPLRPAKSTAV